MKDAGCELLVPFFGGLLLKCGLGRGPNIHISAFSPRLRLLNVVLEEWPRAGWESLFTCNKQRHASSEDNVTTPAPLNLL